MASQSDSAISVSTPHESEFNAAVESLVAGRVMSRICDQDATLWGPDAESEASIRLGWTKLPHTSRSLIGEVEALRQQFNRNGLDHVVLCGMGGSSLAPEVICRAAGVELTVLDSSHPDVVRHALNDRLERSIIVVSSKSGSTVETDSQKRAFEHAIEHAGMDPVDHFVVVTDPGSSLADEAERHGYRVFTADPHVGGRYSALTAFGLVPSGLAGADISALLDEAAEIAPTVSADSAQNPAARLGALLGTAYQHAVDKVVLTETGGRATGVADWIEQLIAESTGKQGHGLLPVVVENLESKTHDETFMTLGGDPNTSGPNASAWAASTDVPLGGAMLLWEYAVAVAGTFIGINPFDQPDVESAKQASRDLLAGSGTRPQPAFTQGNVSVYGPEANSSITDAVAWLLAQIDPDRGFLAVQAYLDSDTYANFAQVREKLESRIQRPVTFGWGPRFLHSTGQYHKGGPATGVFLQITGDPEADLPVPGREFTFGSFIDSQAAGDADVLTSLGRPVVRLHLHDPPDGIAYLRGVLG